MKIADSTPILTASNVLVIEVAPEDTLTSLLGQLQSSMPTVISLPERGELFSDPSHFAQLKEHASLVSFVIPQNRMRNVARLAYEVGFPFAVSLEKAVQQLNEQQAAFQESLTHLKTEMPSRSTPLQERPPAQRVCRSPQLLRSTKSVMLLGGMAIVLILATGLLLPAFAAQPKLTQFAQPAVVMPMGEGAFLSSGQIDPANQRGINDTVSLSLNQVTGPGAGMSYYAWLMPESDGVAPLLLGILPVNQRRAQLSYVDPNHTNLLASYSGIEVTEQPSNQVPTMPSLDPKTHRFVGSIPNTPTPGDEKHFSLLSHLRHLLAQDPELQQLGLSGGLDTWLNRNGEKVLEWASAARDSWAGKQTDLIHRHMLRLVEYLDGSTYAGQDLPPGSPLLVDEQAARIGLLSVRPNQALPAYLSHIDIHLRGLTIAPGHTQQQQQLAVKIDTALQLDTTLLQKVRESAIALAHMSSQQLQSNDALALLDEMVRDATIAYTGQLDPQTGGNVNGIVWIHNELAQLATIPMAPTNR